MKCYLFRKIFFHINEKWLKITQKLVHSKFLFGFIRIKILMKSIS